MKKFLLSLPLLALLLLQCRPKEEPEAPAPRLNEVFSAYLGLENLLPFQRCDPMPCPFVVFKLRGFEDNRCPVGAACPRAGEVSVGFTMTWDQRTTPEFRLSLPSPAKPRTDSTAVTLGGQTYAVILKEVTPLPMPNDTFPKQLRFNVYSL